MDSEDGLFDTIAVIGLSGRFPGAKNVDQFWRNLRNGVESISRLTDEDLRAEGIPPAVFNNPNYVKKGFILEDVEMFDAPFFGFSPREAAMIDPQHRVFLELAWEAVENAGYSPESCQGLIGVYAGASMNDYVFHLYSKKHADGQPHAFPKMLGFQGMISADKDYLATRVSYKLDLRGPSFTVQTGCSTSLVAVHLACQSLLNYQCDLALAGGVCINLPPGSGYLYQEGMILSPDGHCRAFDAGAQGTVLGQGAGIVVLKRLSEAMSDGDTIHAVIKGSAVNNDGARRIGYTAPSVDGQADVIASAQALAQVEPATVTYVETHGTGTPLGDPIEIEALTRAFRASTREKGFCAIGSVKTNVAHLDAAAGVTGLIKTVLALEHKEIPASLHFENPNPRIDFENSPFFVNTKLTEWQSRGGPRRAGVSSFGIGGTNAHAVLEEASVVEDSGDSRPWQLLLLSAKTHTALDTATTNLVEHLRQHPDQNLADVAYTLQVGRKAFSHRRMAVCQNLGDAVACLNTPESKRTVTSNQGPANRDVVFMFSGQGSQYVHMGLELYRTETTFREQIDRCSEILRSHLSFELRDILFPDECSIEDAAQRLNQTYITQPGLFAVEFALARLWMSWGVHPAALVGHSVGEYVAACLAGVFSLEDALSLVTARGRLMQTLPAGSMLAVSLSEKEVQPFLDSKLSMAAINGPSLCVVSGESKAVEVLERQLSSRQVPCRRLCTSHAFHSTMMDPIMDAFTEVVGQIRLNPPRIPFMSNVTGTWITPNEAVTPVYWVRHLRQAVCFSESLNGLSKVPDRILLEVGPGHTLSTLARQHPEIRNNGLTVLSSIRHPKETVSDVAFILNALGRLWLAGLAIDWPGFCAHERRHRLPLPTYPFERKRYWIGAGNLPGKEVLTTRGSCKESTNVPSTRRAHSKRGIDSAYDDAPRNELERSICQIWQRVLGIEQIGIHDSFFELGGNSLLAIQVSSRLRDVYGVKLTLASFFEAPTIAELTPAVEKANDGAETMQKQYNTEDLKDALRLLV